MLFPLTLFLREIALVYKKNLREIALSQSTFEGH